MPKIRLSAVVLISSASALLLASLLIYPLAASSWAQLQDRRAQEREFVIASEHDQELIVRGLLLKEMQQPPLCNPSGGCPEEPIYFDRRSAVLRSSDDRTPWDRYELRTIRPEGSLVNRGDVSVPTPLQELLDRLVQVQTFNADPKLPDLTYVSDPKDLPLLGGPDSCNDVKSPRLVRVSRAAVQESEGLAVALVARTFCDGSGSPRVAKLKRAGSDWLVIEDRNTGQSGVSQELKKK